MLVTKDLGKAKVLNVFFASVLTAKTSLQKSQVLEIRMKDWHKKSSFFDENDQAKE